MALEIVSLEHLPNSHKVYVALFRDVQNAAFLHQQLLARNPQFEYAFIDASVIADAYRRYGISSSTKDLIVVKVTFPGEDGAEPLTHGQIWEHLKSNVEGEAVSITDDQISTTTDVPKVRKYYKLNGLKWLDDIKDEKVKQKEMESLVIGAMALRGV
ncbi:CGI121 like protein [Fusarium agapanthi]|uniref:EKC/KEOPS complex subunit CGI121 n=1 Tax=Fusarium agapanthi TaxID=1803897 RepID=A0A9P5E715_9HYPO|nr:CGI121 like protein [Fusarium agapanthi]